ncbi:SCO1664 family protein [Nakamurella panacisegetis]|uniref:SCO1664 family protein n=1 Tax=Nakamurella panacisegetis TaxID=1090615 RepID=UPI001E47017C|nr:SCO1664 family protein [Nakamurella panacisegetis]
MPTAEPTPPGDAAPPDVGVLEDEQVRDVLTRGTIDITGRLTDASNLTLLASCTLDGVELECVYKPIRGERPLWDFPDGTLAHREVAARRIAEYAGWDCVPLTIMRSGPYGAGMVQRWIDQPEDGAELVDLVPEDDVPSGWLPVLRAVDVSGSDIAVVHADDPKLKVLAGFDVVVNNADRKGSHILLTGDGRVLGVDHGLCFHVDDKLRTILWGWAGTPLPDAVLEGVHRLAKGMSADLRTEMHDYMTIGEVDALAKRIDLLEMYPIYPMPPRGRTPIPWPPL